MSDDINQHRKAIDALDERIVALLNERAAHAKAIGALIDELTRIHGVLAVRYLPQAR